MIRPKGAPYEPNRYVEAHDNERWRDVTKSFVEWLSENATLQNFGFSEGDTVEFTATGKKFFCLSFPEQWEAHLPLFHQWAASANRLHGYVEDGTIVIVDHPELRLKLPEAKNNVATPPWLKRP